MVFVRGRRESIRERGIRKTLGAGEVKPTLGSVVSLSGVTKLDEITGVPFIPKPFTYDIISVRAVHRLRHFFS